MKKGAAIAYSLVRSAAQKMISKTQFYLKKTSLFNLHLTKSKSVAVKIPLSLFLKIAFQLPL